MVIREESVCWLYFIVELDWGGHILSISYMMVLDWT